MSNFREVLRGIVTWDLLDQLAEVETALPEEEGFPYPPLPVKWRKCTEWTHKKDPNRNAIYNEDNIVLRYLTLGQDRGQLFLFEDSRNRDEWTKPAFDVLDGAKPIVFDLMRAVRGEHLGMVIITRLPKGGKIGAHIDRVAPIPGLPYWQRYQVPLFGPTAKFDCGGEIRHLPPGTAQWFDARKVHSVEAGSEPRLSMIVEIRPTFR